MLQRQASVMFAGNESTKEELEDKIRRLIVTKINEKEEEMIYMTRKSQLSGPKATQALRKPVLRRQRT